MAKIRFLDDLRALPNPPEEIVVLALAGEALINLSGLRPIAALDSRRARLLARFRPSPKAKRSANAVIVERSRISECAKTRPWARNGARRRQARPRDGQGKVAEP
jgi:hypothetical protein